MAEGFADQIEELLPAYALNALDDRERDLVERALEREPRYQALLAEYLAGAAGLAPVRPREAAPPGVRTRVLRKVWSPPAAVGRASRMRPRLPVAFLGVAAAWLFAVLGVGAVEMVHMQRVSELEDETESLAAENERQTHRIKTQAELTNFVVQDGVSQETMVSVRDPEPPKQPPTGRVYTDPTGKQWLWVRDLEVPDEGYVYRVWLSEADDDTYQMATFTIEEDGQAYVPMWLSDKHQSPLWISIHLEPREHEGTTPVGPRVLWGRLR